MADSRSDNLWAITCYFNPVGYRRRLENYRIFKQRLKVPLVAVELSFDGVFELAAGDADVLVQLCSRTVLWQKERLLNVALKFLPPACDKVAWLDCDILFESDDWIEHASRALDEFALVHLFQDRNELPIDFTPDAPNFETFNLKSQSVARHLVNRRISAEEASKPNRLMNGSTAGLAWASRRDILDKHGLYDAFIVGGGDKAILLAAMGMSDQLAKAREMNHWRTEHYQAWAKPYSSTVNRCVGHIAGRVFHLWHGDLINRNHSQRHHLFARFDFDPYTDIALDPSGCWRWNSDKKEMQAFVRHYFESRKEDGT
jgi:hypothetical protein